jgi:hypothetical protein
MMVNLLQETIIMLSEYNKSEDDVMFVTDGKHINTWEWFKKNADFLYDDGYGGNEISMGLKIVGKDWWLSRYEYDGSEWWEFRKKPKKQGMRVGELTIRA